jgi:hypothetical protein
MEHGAARGGSASVRFGEYAMYGDERPPLEVLYGLVAAYNRKTEVDDIHTLIVADVFVDRAMADPERAGPDIADARRLLGGIIRVAERLERQDRYTPFRDKAPAYAAALVRRAGLGAWRMAAEGKPPAQSYHTWLTALSDAVSLIPYNPGVVPIVIEAVPVLLGTRGLVRGSRGWLARCALYREDRSPDASTRPNWDVGICTDDSVQGFDRPAIKIDTKRRKIYDKEARMVSRQTEASRNVVKLLASQFGFSSPAQLIWSCVREQGGALPPQLEHIPVLKPRTIDKITERVWTEVTAGPAAQA